MQDTSSSQGKDPSGTETPVIPLQQVRLREAILAQLGGTLVEQAPHAWKEFGLTFSFQRDGMFELFRRLRDDESFLFNMLVDVTCVDWLERREPRFEVVYHLLSLTHLHRLCLRVGVSEDEPEIDSVRELWPAANFMEREVWDMFGVRFANHGDLRRILMYDEFVGHPLRKDYPKRGKQPRVPLRVPELRNTSGDMRREQLVALPVRQRVPRVPE